MTSELPLQRTALWDEHRAAGARLVPFAGWEMPVQYGGVIPEVRAVRQSCGLFDVSHMAQFDVAAADIPTALDRVISADWTSLAPGRVAYALLTTENGGVVDDIMGYRLDESQWLIVSNASRFEADVAHFSKYFDGTLRPRYGHQAMLAIQGPQAAAILSPLVDLDLTTMKRRDVRRVTLDAAPGILARGGYTGSDGFEFIFHSDDAPRVWRALVAAGAIPCGLGARDVLRLEAALPLYGHELREEWTPFESACGWAVKFSHSDDSARSFPGRETLLQSREPKRSIAALRVEGRAIPREEYKVLCEGQECGEVTSGTMSPTVEGGIALAMLPATISVGDAVEIVVRDRPHAAHVVTRPFVAHANVISTEKHGPRLLPALKKLRKGSLESALEKDALGDQG